MPTIVGLRVLVIGVIGFLTILGLTPVAASSANISHSYHSDGSIPNGSLVSLDPQRSNYIKQANTDNQARLTGVAVAVNDSLLAVNSGTDTVQVATSGSVNALVSTLNGDIDVGDQVAVSPFDGIGMKALPGSHLIGLAETSFNKSTSGASQQTVHDQQGKAHYIWLGFSRVSIAIGTNTISSNNTAQLNFLQKLAKNLTGHTVSTLRVATSLTIAIVTLLTMLTLIYASIYGSIISVGRNPLAKFAIFRTLGSVMSMVFLVTAASGAAIFFLLK